MFNLGLWYHPNPRTYEYTKQRCPLFMVSPKDLKRWDSRKDQNKTNLNYLIFQPQLTELI